MISNNDFTGKIVFKYWETDENDRGRYWKEPHVEGGIEVTVPMQRFTNIYGQEFVVPEHTEIIPFTADEVTHLKHTYDKIKKRVKSQINK